MGNYRYLIYNAEGALVIEQNIWFRDCPKITQTDGFIVIRASEGPSHVIERYYDVKSDRLSEYFLFPILIDNRFVAYMENLNGEPALIVQDVFDASAFYEEHRFDFVPYEYVYQLSKLLVNATLVNENQIEVTYLSGYNFHETTAIVDIRAE